MFEKEKLKENSGLKELLSFDFPSMNLSRHWMEIKFEWINKSE
jgi:hypothetical protein